MSSFNADAFLTSGNSMVKLNNNSILNLNKNRMVKITNSTGLVKLGNNNGIMKYRVMSTGSDISQDSLLEEQSPQMPFIPPSVAAN